MIKLVARKIHRLFGAVHPIFGTSSYHNDISGKQAIKMGKKLEEGDGG